MRKTKELKNIGKIVENEIVLSDTSLSIYIPIETESEIIKAEREKFEGWLIRDTKAKRPNIDLSKCTLYRETDLFVNTGYRDESGKYVLDFSVGFMMWFEDENGEEIYCDTTNQFDIELSEEDKAYVKKIMAEKIVEVLV